MEGEKEEGGRIKKGGRREREGGRVRQRGRRKGETEEGGREEGRMCQ